LVKHRYGLNQEANQVARMVSIELPFNDGWRTITKRTLCNANGKLK